MTGKRRNSPDVEPLSLPAHDPLQALPHSLSSRNSTLLRGTSCRVQQSVVSPLYCRTLTPAVAIDLWIRGIHCVGDVSISIVLAITRLTSALRPTADLMGKDVLRALLGSLSSRSKSDGVVTNRPKCTLLPD